MNKQQYKLYRHHQRVACDPEWGYCDKNEAFFSKIPLEQPGVCYKKQYTLMHAWEMVKREVVFVPKEGGQSWEREMVVVGNNNPNRGHYMRAELKDRYTYK